MIFNVFRHVNVVIWHLNFGFMTERYCDVREVQSLLAHELDIRVVCSCNYCHC